MNKTLLVAFDIPEENYADLKALLPKIQTLLWKKVDKDAKLWVGHWDNIFGGNREDVPK